MDIDNLFDDDSNSGSLFDDASSSSSLTTPVAKTSAMSAASDTTVTHKQKRLSAEERQKRFQVLHDFISPRVGRHPSIPHPPIRHTALTQLVGLANSREHLDMVAELFPQWKERGFAVKELPATFFIRAF